MCLSRERSQFEKATHCMIPTIHPSGKSETGEIVKKINDFLGQGERSE